MNTSALTVSLRHTVCSDFQADSRWRKEAMQSIVCKRPVTFFSLIFVSTFRALAIYQHAGAHHKLHVVLCSRSDWCCVYVLCVQCAHWPKRESVRKKERERERVFKMDAIHIYWLRAQREGIWSPPCQARRAASYMSDKRNRARVWLDGVLRQWGTWFSRLFLWQRGSVLSALQHCGWGERGEESLCGTPSWAPNQAPPCGAWANRQLATEVKDCQLQERAAGREGLLGNLDPSFPSSPNVLNW